MKKLLVFILFLIAGFFGTVYVNRVGHDRAVVEEKKTIAETPPFDINLAPQQSLEGALTLEGPALWEPRSATAPARFDMAPVRIRQGERLVTETGGRARISFGEAANVDMAEDSDVEFAQTLRDNMVVVQRKGSVSYEKTGDTPLSVRVRHLLAVIAGSASVSADPETGVITVTAIKGNVDLGYNDLDFITQKREISEGEKFVFDDENREVIRE